MISGHVVNNNCMCCHCQRNFLGLLPISCVQSLPIDLVVCVETSFVYKSVTKESCSSIAIYYIFKETIPYNNGESHSDIKNIQVTQVQIHKLNNTVKFQLLLQ